MKEMVHEKIPSAKEIYKLLFWEIGTTLSKNIAFIQ